MMLYFPKVNVLMLCKMNGIGNVWHAILKTASVQAGPAI